MYNKMKQAIYIKMDEIEFEAIATLVGIIIVLINAGLVGWVVLGLVITILVGAKLWDWYRERRERDRLIQLIQQALDIDIDLEE
jgi:Flp pilus assembly protein TadB